MKKNIKPVFLLFLLLLCLPLTVSCAQNGKTAEAKIVCTLFPPYDFAREIAGDEVEVVLLKKAGDAHSSEVTAGDVRTIASAALFICAGGVEDVGYEKIIAANAPDLPVLKMLDVCTPLYDEDGDEPDEHVWTSPKNAILLTEAIRDRLCGLMPEKSDIFRRNADAYLERLKKLEADYASFFATPRTLVFGDRFPFAYLAADYGITCLAAFPGCSEESEPSARVISDLIDYVKENKIGTIYRIENSTGKVAESIASATGASVALLHSCHTLSEEEIASGIGYIERMERNLETIRASSENP